MGGVRFITKNKQQTDIAIDLVQNNVALTVEEIAELYDIDVNTARDHIWHILAEGESPKKNRRKQGLSSLYSLDIILAVGFRVKSLKGTQFRMWALRNLKNTLITNYKLGKQQLSTTPKVDQLNELQKLITFFQQKARNALLAGQEKELLNLLGNYSKSLSLLGQYDSDDLHLLPGHLPSYQLTYEEALEVIKKLKTDLIDRKEASEIFGREFSAKFESVVGTLYQTFDGVELYPTTEEKAAHLLYLTIKDHPFLDGNKRIGSFMFVYFLNRNKALYKKNNERKINDNALVSLALLIAVSDPKEKDTMIALISHLLQ